MIDLAKTVLHGVIKLFTIKFPGLNISFFSVFIAVAILHVVINTILTIYGLRSSPLKSASESYAIPDTISVGSDLRP